MKIRIRKRYLFFILAFSSAIFNAIGSAFDAVSQLYIPDPWALGIACFITGVIISVLFSDTNIPRQEDIVSFGSSALRFSAKKVQQ